MKKNTVKNMMDWRTQILLCNLESRSGVVFVMMEGNYSCKLLSSMVGVLTINLCIISIALLCCEFLGKSVGLSSMALCVVVACPLTSIASLCARCTRTYAYTFKLCRVCVLEY